MVCICAQFLVVTLIEEKLKIQKRSIFEFFENPLESIFVTHYPVLSSKFFSLSFLEF